MKYINFQMLATQSIQHTRHCPFTGEHSPKPALMLPCLTNGGMGKHDIWKHAHYGEIKFLFILSTAPHTLWTSSVPSEGLWKGPLSGGHGTSRAAGCLLRWPRVGHRSACQSLLQRTGICSLTDHQKHEPSKQNKPQCSYFTWLAWNKSVNSRWVIT